MRKTSMKVNAIFNAIRTLINILFPLVTFKYISQVLLTDNIGKVNFSNSVISYFTLIADFGIATYAVREGAKYRSNKQRFEEFASDIFSLNIFTMILSYILLIFLISIYEKLDVYKWILIIQSGSLMFNVIGATWINTIYEDYKSILYRSLFVQIISLILLFAFVRDQNDYYQYAMVSVLAQSGVNIINSIYIRKYCRLKVRFSKKMLHYIPALCILMGISITTTVYVNSDITMIGLFRGDSEVAYYSVAVKIYNVIKAILAAIIIVGIPRLTELYFSKDYDRYRELSLKSLNVLLTFMLPIIAGVFLLSEEAVLLVSGVQYLDSVVTLKILCIAVAFAVLATYITDIIILPQGIEKGALYAAALSAVMNIVLNLIMIPQYGFNGAAITTVISEAFVCIISIIYVYFKDKKNLRFILNKEIGRNLIKSMIGIAIFYLISNYIIKCFEIGVIRCVVIIGLSVILYIISMIIMKQDVIMEILKKLVVIIKK